jgi:hypothetical protein
MFIMNMPVTFKIGDSADCTINGEPKLLSWRDAQTLVIEPDDARTIEHQSTDGELITFICSDQDGSRDFDIIRADI